MNELAKSELLGMTITVLSEVVHRSISDGIKSHQYYFIGARNGHHNNKNNFVYYRAQFFYMLSRHKSICNSRCCCKKSPPKTGCEIFIFLPTLQLATIKTLQSLHAKLKILNESFETNLKCSIISRDQSFVYHLFLSKL